MNIKYDNSMFTANPPSIPTPTPSPEEELEEQIQTHLDEENYFGGFIDLETIRVCELIKNGKNETIR